MELTTTKQGSVAILSITGNISQEDTVEFRDTLKGIVERGDCQIVLDFSEMNYLCSMALTALMQTHKLAKAKGGDVFISGPNKVTRDLLMTTNLMRVFKVFDALNTAVESLK